MAISALKHSTVIRNRQKIRIHSMTRSSFHRTMPKSKLYRCQTLPTGHTTS